MENMQSINTQTQVSNGSDVDVIEVHTPNFFERHFLHLLTLFGIGFLIFTFIFQIQLTPIYIVGRSMQPTINTQSQNANDLEHCDLVYYKHSKHFNKGDIVVINAANYLNGQTDPIIKRVIATEGDTLTFEITQVIPDLLTFQNLHVYKCYYKIYLNGELLNEDYIAEQNCYLEIKTNNTGEFVDSIDYSFLRTAYNTLYQNNPLQYIHTGSVSITIEADQVFVCGDNRNYSTDSRFFGAVKTNDILGTMALHIPYGTNFFVGLFKEIFA